MNLYGLLRSTCVHMPLYLLSAFIYLLSASICQADSASFGLCFLRNFFCFQIGTEKIVSSWEFRRMAGSKWEEVDDVWKPLTERWAESPGSQRCSGQNAGKFEYAEVDGEIQSGNFTHCEVPVQIFLYRAHMCAGEHHCGGHLLLASKLESTFSSNALSTGDLVARAFRRSSSLAMNNLLLSSIFETLS